MGAPPSRTKAAKFLKVRQIVEPVSFAALRADPPSFATRSKLTSSQARGKTFERKVIKELARAIKAGELPPGTELLVGPWINFTDENGPGICQPDAILLTASSVLIIEAKLKQSARAIFQLCGLYSPLVKVLWPRPTHLLLEVFKFPRCGKTPHWVDSPANFLANPRPGVHYWHYLP